MDGFISYTDASNLVYGVILIQQEKAIAYAQDNWWYMRWFTIGGSIICFESMEKLPIWSSIWSVHRSKKL